jgi:hypothetical protein
MAAGAAGAFGNTAISAKHAVVINFFIPDIVHALFESQWQSGRFSGRRPDAPVQIPTDQSHSGGIA